MHGFHLSVTTNCTISQNIFFALLFFFLYLNASLKKKLYFFVLRLKYEYTF